MPGSIRNADAHDLGRIYRALVGSQPRTGGSDQEELRSPNGRDLQARPSGKPGLYEKWFGARRVEAQQRAARDVIARAVDRATDGRPELRCRLIDRMATLPVRMAHLRGLASALQEAGAPAPGAAPAPDLHRAAPQEVVHLHLAPGRADNVAARHETRPRSDSEGSTAGYEEGGEELSADWFRRIPPGEPGGLACRKDRKDATTGPSRPAAPESAPSGSIPEPAAMTAPVQAGKAAQAPA